MAMSETPPPTDDTEPIDPPQPTRPTDSGASLDDAEIGHDGSSSPESSGDPEAPMILIQYRDRFWPSFLIPPLILVTLASLIVAIAPQVPRTYTALENPLARTESEGASESEDVPTRDNGLTPSQIARPEQLVEPSEPASNDASDIGLSDDLAFDEPPPLPEGLRPLQDPDVLNANEPDELETEAILREIREAAQDKQERLDQLADLKGDPAQIRAEMAREQDFELRNQIARDRTAYRRELRKILQRAGAKAATEIDQLNQRYGRTMTSATRFRMETYLTAQPIRGGRPSPRVVYDLRRIGVPEPVILDIFTYYQSLSINARGGPRNAADALRRAAVALINIPQDADQAKR